jgi:hypothetical protein
MAHTEKATKEKVDFQGLPLIIEWPKGSVRTGVNAEGEPWERTMSAAYGYVDGAETSADGEDLDVYVGSNPEAPEAFVIEQMTEDGETDEFKVMLGFDSEDEAVETYRKHYPPEWDNVGEVFPLAMDRLKELIDESSPQKDKAKVAAFLLLEDVRAIGKKVLESAEFQRQIESIGPGKTLKELDIVELDQLGALPLPKFSSRLLQPAV